MYYNGDIMTPSMPAMAAIFKNRVVTKSPGPTLLPNFYVYLQHYSCKHVFSIRVENSIAPGQMVSPEVS